MLSKRVATYEGGDEQTRVCPECGGMLVSRNKDENKIEQVCANGHVFSLPAASDKDGGVAGQTNISEASLRMKKRVAVLEKVGGTQHGHMSSILSEGLEQLARDVVNIKNQLYRGDIISAIRGLKEIAQEAENISRWIKENKIA